MKSGTGVPPVKHAQDAHATFKLTPTINLIDPAPPTIFSVHGNQKNRNSELAGISGKMEIKITDGKHFYEFDYTLAATP